jgi:hypothetical protein
VRVKFYRRLVAVLPGQGFQEWYYFPEEKKVESFPILGWAVYRHEASPHECRPGCECREDDDAEVVPFSADSTGSVEEVTGVLEPSNLIGVLSEGKTYSLEEAFRIYCKKQREEADSRARAEARQGARSATSPARGIPPETDAPGGAA